MYRMIKKMRKKDANKIVTVENNVSIEEAVKHEIEELYEKHPNREICFRSIAISKDIQDYTVDLPILRENFKKDFFIYWLGIISDLIAMRIEIEGDSVLIIKEQFEQFA